MKRLLSGKRRKPAHPGRILVAHQLLLGDTRQMFAPCSRACGEITPRPRSS